MPEDQARATAQVVVGFRKAKLLPPIAAPIDAALKRGHIGDLAQGLGGMLGKKKCL